MTQLALSHLKNFNKMMRFDNQRSTLIYTNEQECRIYEFDVSDSRRAQRTYQI